ncbi:MAG: tetratricopeptide repeat protein [Acidobacteriota bacterium]
MSTGPLDRTSLSKVLEHQGIDPRRVVLPYEMTEEMRYWAREAAGSGSDLDRLISLRDRLLDPNALEVQYTWSYTGTASEVFHNREANCLAFTNLFLGMARYLEIPAYFLAVENVETYRRDGDLVIVSDHVAVGYGESFDVRVFDFSQYPEAPDQRFAKRISDLTAIAMFHSNRGAEALQKDLREEAAAWLRVAVEVDPTLVQAWVNLGVAERRLGFHEAAEAAYLRALEINPRTPSAVQNLASLLRVLDRVQEAESYEAALAEASTQNPYTFLNLGDISLEGGRYEDARRFYRRAVSLSRNAETYAALGYAEAAAGDLRKARKMLRRAQRINASHERVAALKSRLSGS